MKTFLIILAFITILVLNAKYGCENVDAKASCNQPAHPYQYNYTK